MDKETYCTCDGELYFSRMVPMGYVCSVCGYEVEPNEVDEDDAKEFGKTLKRAAHLNRSETKGNE